MSKYTFEDFVPLSETEALITSGKRITALTEIERTEYSVHDGRVKLGRHLCTLASGVHLRLGHLYGRRLIYSDGLNVFGAPAPTGAHQPFLHDGALYYTADWPLVRIYKDDQPYLGHFGDMIQVGNPHWAGDTMYFECRDDPSDVAVSAWQVWRQKEGEAPEFVVRGANPAVFNGILFYGHWTGAEFEYRTLRL